MTPIVVLVAGTHGHHDSWWKPESDFSRMLLSHGIRVADNSDPYAWCTRLEGLFGNNVVWDTSGKALRWYARSKVRHYPLSVVAHSHGGQVAAYAAAQGLQIERLVTVATPVRGDMDEVYSKAAQNIGRWVHLHSNNDIWQVLGGLMDGKWGIHREVPYADENIMVPDIQHSDFLHPELWEENGWWTYIK